MKVDAHQHFWRLADREGRWPPASLAAIHRDFGPQDLAPQLQATEVDATVLVQSLPSVADTHWMLSVAAGTSFVRGVVMQRVEDFARARGLTVVTPELLGEIRQSMPIDFSKRRPFFLKD